MPVNPAQYEVLMKGLNASRVAKRKGGGGKQLSYLEAWDVRAHLIRVFGFANWSAEVLKTDLAFEEAPGENGRNWNVGYQVILQLTVNDEWGKPLAVYSEAAVGSAQLPQRGEAHDMAIKGLALDTPIPTPYGWTTMGELQVGDTVFDMDGKPCRVTVKSDVKNLPCYEVTASNGDSIVCDDEHYWVATIGQQRQATHQIGDLYAAKRSGKPVTLPVAGSLDLPDQPLPMDPYLFGLWLGDGSAAAARLTANAHDVEHYEAAMRAAGVVPGKRQQSAGAYTVSMLGQRKVLADMGALGDKVIPSIYLRGSVAQRRALLAGLMDSDGTVSRGRASFVAKRREHAEAVAELAWSLGERPRLSSGQRSGFGVTGMYHFVDWTPVVNPFSLPRKASKLTGRSKRVYNAVKSVTKVDSVPTACIAVDSPTRTYLAGKSMIPTHNTAESDALKRAAVNLGDQFGLSLYKDGATAPVVKMTVTHPAENAPTAPVKAPVAAEPALSVEETDPAIQYLLDALRPLETVENAGERIVGIANFKAANGAHLDEQVLIYGESISLARYCDLIAAGAYRKYQGDEDE